MKHTLTFQGKKIGLSIACKKSTLYLCTNKENNAIRQKCNKTRYNSLFDSGLVWFILIISGKRGCFLSVMLIACRESPPIKGTRTLLERVFVVLKTTLTRSKNAPNQQIDKQKHYSKGGNLKSQPFC